MRSMPLRFRAYRRMLAGVTGADWMQLCAMNAAAMTALWLVWGACTQRRRAAELSPPTECTAVTAPPVGHAHPQVPSRTDQLPAVRPPAAVLSAPLLASIQVSA